MRLTLAIFLALTLFFPSSSNATEPTGTLTGVIQDANGAVVPGARVTVQTWKSGMKPSGQISYKVDAVLVTDSSGRFSIRLREGQYDVFVSHPALLPSAERASIKPHCETSLELHLRFDPSTVSLP